jgi:hypothetical protein
MAFYDTSCVLSPMSLLLIGSWSLYSVFDLSCAAAFGNTCCVALLSYCNSHNGSIQGTKVVAFV